MSKAARLFFLSVVLCAGCTLVLCASNPADIVFRLRLTKDLPVYHIGDLIEFDLSYSSTSPKKYQVDTGTTSSAEMNSFAPQVTPPEGFFDLPSVGRGRPIAISILSGIGYLNSQPVAQHSDLTYWYRFQKPGHYRLTVTSNAVRRLRPPEEGGGSEPQVLESNPVEFDILPPDPSWEASELSDCLQAFDSAKTDPKRNRAVQRMAMLDTLAAVHELVRLYVSMPDLASASNELGHSLSASSHSDVIIPLLEAALSDPAVNPPPNLADLLADLKVRKKFGLVPAVPTDPATHRQWEKELKLRQEAHNDFVAQANAVLLSSLPRRSGRSRSGAIYQAWYSAETWYGANALAPEILPQLRLDVLNLASDLTPHEQMQYVTLAWKSMPHTQLLPLIRALVVESPVGSPTYRGEAYQFWCEEWPTDCSAAILSEALKPNSRVPPYVVLLMSEAEHPELDPLLKEKLVDPAMSQDSQESQRAAAIILRAGSRGLKVPVDAFFVRLAAKQGNACQVEGFVLAYLFRVAPETATKHLAKELQDAHGVCGSQLFRVLHTARFSEEEIPAAIKALDSPNLGAAGTAALFLAEHGSPPTQDSLWQRLDALWNAWREHAAALRVTPTEDGILQQSAVLEQELASALTHARNWKLSEGELDRLHRGCLTDQCRSIADGKMFHSL